MYRVNDNIYNDTRMSLITLLVQGEYKFIYETGDPDLLILTVFTRVTMIYFTVLFCKVSKLFKNYGSAKNSRRTVIARKYSVTVFNDEQSTFLGNHFDVIRVLTTSYFWKI